MDKNINLLKSQITTLIEKSSTLGSDYAKIQAEVIRLEIMVDELSKIYKQNYDELKSENQILKDEFNKFSSQICSKIDCIDKKIDAIDQRMESRIERMESRIESRIERIEINVAQIHDDVGKIMCGLEKFFNLYNISMD